MAYDLNYKIANNLRKRIGVAIRNGQKAGSAVDELGCSIGLFKTYIEQLFRPGMSWDNWGAIWFILFHYH